MQHSDRTPIFNLKAVVQETGIKPDTLRAWERRYGIPTPQRAESGHRLYTRRDIDILKWLLQRQKEGLSISRAVALWQKLEKEQGDPLQNASAPDHNEHLGMSTFPSARWSEQKPVQEPNAAFGNAFLPRNDHPQFDDAPGERLHTLREQWIAATLAFDEQAANATLTTAFGLFSPEVVCIELIQKSLSIIGTGWYEGRVTVQQEHFASALAIRRLDSILAATPPPTRQGRILVGCPPEEAHTFVPLMLSLLLRRKGWNVIYLGADIPVQSLELTIHTTCPDLVLLSAQQLHTVVGLKEMAKVLTESHIALGYGGLIFNRFPRLKDIVPGYFLGNELYQAVQVVEQLMDAPRPRAAVEQIDPAFSRALNHFQERRARIEAAMWKRLTEENLLQRLLVAGNANFGRSIQTALALGNLAYLESDIEWIQGLLYYHYRMPRYRVDDFVVAYRRAAHLHLDERGKPLLEWLDQLYNTVERRKGDRAQATDPMTDRNDFPSRDSLGSNSWSSITDYPAGDSHNP